MSNRDPGQGKRRRVAPPAPVAVTRRRTIASDVRGDYAYNLRHALIITNTPRIGGLLTGRGIEFDD